MNGQGAQVLLSYDPATQVITDGDGKEYTIEEAKSRWQCGRALSGNNNFSLLFQHDFNIEVVADILKGWDKKAKGDGTGVNEFNLLGAMESLFKKQRLFYNQAKGVAVPVSCYNCKFHEGCQKKCHPIVTCDEWTFEDKG